MTIDELLARESIRDLIARYNSYGDTGRFAQLWELFADDIVMELRMIDGTIELYEGLESVQGIFTGTKSRVDAQAATGGPTYVRHSTTTHQIDLVDADHATSRCYFSVIMHHGLDHWGRYVDQFRRVDGEWKFVRRTMQLDGRSEASWMS